MEVFMFTGIDGKDHEINKQTQPIKCMNVTTNEFKKYAIKTDWLIVDVTEEVYNAVKKFIKDNPSILNNDNLEEKIGITTDFGLNDIDVSKIRI